MTRDQLITLFFLALLSFVIYQLFQIFSPFLNSIFWAAIIAFGFYTLYDRLKRNLIHSELWASVVMTLLIGLVIIPPVIFLFVNLTNQALDLYESATAYVRSGHLEKLIDEMRKWTLVQKIETHLFQWEPLKKSVNDWIVSGSKNIANYAVSQAGIITKNIVTLSFGGLLTAFLVFIFLKDGAKIYGFIYQIAPLEEKNKKPLFKQINDTFAAVIRGQIVTSITQAILSGTIYWALNLPAPIFFSVATFFATLIPILGAVSVWLPLTIYLISTGEMIKGIVLIIMGVSVISMIDNILKPALIGERTKLPYFLLFFGILGGLKVYGLTGIFLAPVILSIFFSLVKIYEEKYL